MKQFTAFVRKEFYHILRDKRTMLILIGMPIAQIILFGFAISTEVRHVQTAVLAPSPQTDVRKLMEQLDASEYFTVKYIVHSPAEIEQMFRRNQIELAVIFPSDLHRFRFDPEQIQILADATEPNLAVTRSTYAQTILQKALQSIQPVATSSQGGSTKLLPVVAYNKLLYNPQMKSAYNFVPGVMGLILMLICAMMTSISIVREKETGTMEVLLVSPVNPFFVILSKTVPYFVLSLLNLTTILLLSVFVLNVPIAGSLTALLGVSLLFIFVSLALGLLISCITRTQVAALLISAMVLLIPTIILSGIIFPVESMPDILQALSCLIPARWYVAAVRRLMIEGVPLAYVWKEITVLCLMAVLLIAATTRKFKNRLE